MSNDLHQARTALQSIPPDLAREDWVRAGMAAQAAGLEFDDFNDWSAQAGNYDARSAQDTWRSFKPGKGVGAGTLFRLATEHGWRPEETKREIRPKTQRRAPPEIAKPRAGMRAAEIWARCKPATNSHPYIVRKMALAVPLENLRVVSEGDPLCIAGESMVGALVVPVINANGAVSSLQFITPPETSERLKQRGRPDKLNLPSHAIEGFFTVGEITEGHPVYIVEGIGAAWACWRATGAAAVVCFGAGNMAKVASQLREQHPGGKLVLVPDVGKEKQAADIASEISALVAAMPEGWPQNSDVHDLAESEGIDVLETLLEDATAPPVTFPLSVAFASELPEEFTPPDELVQGVLTAEDGTVLYGDSNSGKTFFVIDLACAVARGVDWMGRRTEKGAVVYLAAESPASVRSRLQAYQLHHRCRVPNFAIVQSPVDLFDGDADANKVIAIVRLVERETGQKVRLIVGDTLARLSAGANENAGQDMSLVVRRFDHIRSECKAHFLLIHHSGKAAANGARGWSGIRAAVDTEIEVTDTPAGRCCEITKQRDLSTKGERIGFRLEPVTLGQTKWGTAATSCVVLPAEAPPQAATGKRISACDGAVLEFLMAHKVGIKKGEVVKHFAGRYEKGPIYRSMKSLVEAGAAHEAAGMVSAAGAVK